jgi:hypothetical protein
VDCHWVIPSIGSLRLVDELVGLHRLFGDGAEGLPEDLALSACLPSMLGRLLTPRRARI